MTEKARKRCLRLGGRAGSPANSRDYSPFLTNVEEKPGKRKRQESGPSRAEGSSRHATTITPAAGITDHKLSVEPMLLESG